MVEEYTEEIIAEPSQSYHSFVLNISILKIIELIDLKVYEINILYLI